MAQMHNPPHSGEVLRDSVFNDAAVSVTDFAARLGVTRVALSRVLNGKAAISAEMALRLAAALGGSAQSWLHMQANYRPVARRARTKAASRENRAIEAGGLTRDWVPRLDVAIATTVSQHKYL